MPTLTIRTRTTASGEKRYDVRYRLGGRLYPLLHGGTFKTMREARARRDLIAGELAAGRNPEETLRATKPKRTITGLYNAWRESRLDLDPATLRNCDLHWKRLGPTFGSLTLHDITFLEVQEWISAH